MAKLKTEWMIKEQERINKRITEQKEIMEVCDFNHVLLYAKGHYKQDNIIDDLKKIYAKRSAINPEDMSLSDVCELSLNALEKYAPNKVSHVIEDLFKNSIRLFYDKKEYSNEFYLTIILQSILSKLRYILIVKNEKIILNLGEPDKNILPLVDHKEEEKQEKMKNI